MRRTPKMYADKLYETLQSAPVHSWSPISRSFFTELVRRGDMKLMPKILSYLELLEEKRGGKVHVTVRSATPLDRTTLESSLQRLFPNVGTIVHEIQDPSVIGGVSFETRDRRFDLTLKRGLSHLRQTMIHS